jgi:hypothetical protein
MTRHPRRTDEQRAERRAELRAALRHDPEIGVVDFRAPRERGRRGATAMLDDDRRRKILRSVLPERLRCPGMGGNWVPRDSCLSCGMAVGRCAVVLPYIPTALLKPDREETTGIGGQAVDTIPGSLDAQLARSKPRPIELDEETRALLADRRGFAPPYPCPEARRRGKRLNVKLVSVKTEAREAAARGDEPALRRAVATLRALVREREALREEPVEVSEPSPVEVLATIDEAAAKDLFEDSEPASRALEPSAPEIILKLDGALTGYALSEALDGLGRTVRAGHGSLRRWRAHIEIAPEKVVSS